MKKGGEKLPFFSKLKTMLIDTEIKKLFGLVGWAKDANTNDVINVDLNESRSGLYFNSAHPLLTLNNISAVVFDDTAKSFPVWIATKEYQVDDVVTYNGKKYISIQEGTNQNPTVDKSEYWVEFSSLHNWLKTETENGIITTIQDFIRTKQLTGKHLLESKTIFDGLGNIYKSNQKYGKVVGLEITLPKSKGVALKLEKVGIQATSTGTLNLYLFHSSNKDPLLTIPVEITKANSMNWIDLTNIILRYQTQTTDAGGSYYLCYLDSDLTGESINRGYRFDEVGCLTCDHSGYKAISKYMAIKPFKANSDSISQLWDIDTNAYYFSNNWGLNLQLSLYCDLSTFIVEQEQMFSDLIQLGVAKYILRKMAFNYNANINRNIRNFPDLATLLYEIDGNPEGRAGGLRMEYDKAMKAIKLDTNGIGWPCLPCNTLGVRYKSVR